MINKIKNIYSSIVYSRTVRIKVISSIVFVVLFFLICAAFEWMYRGSVINQINSLIHNILWFGVK
jgi:hypothetical protein